MFIRKEGLSCPRLTTGGWHCGIEERDETNADASLTVNPVNTGTASNRSNLLVIAVEKP
jgi:hypothetical protein